MHTAWHLCAGFSTDQQPQCRLTTSSDLFIDHKANVSSILCYCRLQLLLLFERQSLQLQKDGAVLKHRHVWEERAQPRKGMSIHTHNKQEQQEQQEQQLYFILYTADTFISDILYSFYKANMKKDRMKQLIKSGQWMCLKISSKLNHCGIFPRK